ncbi:MAG: sigma-70 family RNA polymerase sigma factor [Gemmatimonadota bacterium]|nr:sigma-70 family RNA polymerase sigma factor [Gemmatimonadota bacterium]
MDGAVQVETAATYGAAASAGSGVTPDSMSFEQLLTPLLSPAFGIAMSLVGNAADAEDAVQDAALRALRGFDSFQPGTNFKAWFYKILTNCCFGRHRQEKRRPAAVDLDDVPDLYLYARTAASGLHTVSSDPAALLMEKMSLEQVRAAIDALPAEYRVVATMFFLDDLTYEEIADMLGIPVGTVRSRLHRGRRMLQKALWLIAEEAGIVQELSRGSA